MKTVSLTVDEDVMRIMIERTGSSSAQHVIADALTMYQVILANAADGGNVVLIDSNGGYLRMISTNAIENIKPKNR